MDEIFQPQNIIGMIVFQKTTSSGASQLSSVGDYILWYAKNVDLVKAKRLLKQRTLADDVGNRYTRIETADYARRVMASLERQVDGDVPKGAKVYRHDNITSARPAGDGDLKQYVFEGIKFTPGKRTFMTDESRLNRLAKANRLAYPTKRSLVYVRYFDGAPFGEHTNIWTDTQTGAFSDPKTYVVQTNTKVVQRCLLMATDPGDLVLDPTCGSGTTAFVAEQWGRRWITIDTSRVALALARARIMGARYPYYLLADTPDGQLKEAEVTRSAPSTQPTRGDVRAGFVYERVPHVTLKSIANNEEIDTIWDDFQTRLEPLREVLNTALGEAWEEWEIPREARAGWSDNARSLHARWWTERIARQKEIDASIAARADVEMLVDRPYEDKKKVRVAGPFTVESLTPHRVLTVDEDGELQDEVAEASGEYSEEAGFVHMVLDHLRTSGVQQAHREDRISFAGLAPWPGEYVCAEGEVVEDASGDGAPRRAAVFVGPEFGTVSRPDLVAAAREAADAGFDVLVACAFNFDAHASDFQKLGRVPVLKARMNADLHMAADLKNTGAGNLFVVFGEPDIDLLDADDGKIQVRINGVDVFHPATGEVRSDGPDGIACWFVDTDYNEESFFVRHAYFLGANDPYKALKTTLKAEIDADAWATLHSDTSRPFDKPESGRIAVKVINHLGDEVMKVFRID